MPALPLACLLAAVFLLLLQLPAVQRVLHVAVQAADTVAEVLCRLAPAA